MHMYIFWYMNCIMETGRLRVQISCSMHCYSKIKALVIGWSVFVCLRGSFRGKEKTRNSDFLSPPQMTAADRSGSV